MQPLSSSAIGLNPTVLAASFESPDIQDINARPEFYLVFNESLVISDYYQFNPHRVLTITHLFHKVSWCL